MNRKTTSYYDLLNVDPRSSDEDIKRAYYVMAKRFHPDLHPHNRDAAELRLRKINEAYNTLKNREGRARYNHKIRMQAKAENDNAGNASFFGQFADLFRPQPTTKHIQK